MNDLAPVLTVYLVFVALLMGSFINLAADRIPRGESVIRPRSHCRSCNRHLNFVDLLPVAGYLIRRGRCATCGTPIGASAPLVEAACGAIMALAIVLLGFPTGAVAGLALVVLFGVAVITVQSQVTGRLTRR